MSLALGAFIAGLIISESDYGLQALSDVLPFRDTFSGIFFISVGMLLDVRYVVSHAAVVLSVTVAVMVVKAAIVIIVVRLLKRSLRVGILSGFGLAQVGGHGDRTADRGSRGDGQDHHRQRADRWHRARTPQR